MKPTSDDYLQEIPYSAKKYGICKLLTVRAEVIHYKHIQTEIFIRKSIDVQKYLDKIGWDRN